MVWPHMSADIIIFKITVCVITHKWLIQRITHIHVQPQFYLLGLRNYILTHLFINYYKYIFLTQTNISSLFTHIGLLQVKHRQLQAITRQT